jgi:hypothetical protein
MIPPQRAVVIFLALSGALTGTLCGQDAAAADQGAEMVNYALEMVYAESGYGSYSVAEQHTQVLSIPVSIWIRNLEPGRRFGLRLRLTGIIGFTEFEKIGDFDLESVRLGALIPGIEVMVPLSETSMLRPYLGRGRCEQSRGGGSVGIRRRPALRVHLAVERVGAGTRATGAGQHHPLE